MVARTMHSKHLPGSGVLPCIARAVAQIVAAKTGTIRGLTSVGKSGGEEASCSEVRRAVYFNVALRDFSDESGDVVRALQHGESPLDQLIHSDPSRIYPVAATKMSTGTDYIEISYTACLTNGVFRNTFRPETPRFSFFVCSSNNSRFYRLAAVSSWVTDF